MQQSFFSWYYTSGLRSAFLVWMNYIRAFWQRGNIPELFRTLLAPWHRDNSSGTFRGFHPLLVLERLTMNGLSRVIGMFVRLGTIGLMFGVLLGVVVVGGILWIAFMGAPFFVLLAFFSFLFQGSLFVLFFVLGVGGLALAVYGYIQRERVLLSGTSFEALRESLLFSNILLRLGFAKEIHTLIKTETEDVFLERLKQKNLTQDDLLQAATLELYFADVQYRKSRFWTWEQLSRQRRIGRSWKFGYTVRLDRYSIDLTKADYSAYSENDLIGKEENLRALLQALERSSQNGALLVGEPGIGKQSLIYYVARLIRENALAGTLFDDMRVLLFDIERALDDAENQGLEMEQYLRQLLTEATLAGNCILIVTHFERYLYDQGNGKNFRGVFEEFLAYPNFRLIGTTDQSGKTILEKEAQGVLGLLEIILISETNSTETERIVLTQFHSRERRDGILTLKALQSIFANAESLHWEVPFPERALDLAEAILVANGGQKVFIEPEDVLAYIAEKTGIPKGEISQEEKEKLLHLEQELHARVIGQEQALRQVSEALRKTRAGFGNTKKPIGSFLFLGPTGVGKTETAKALASVYFGSEDKMIRLDMSEFQTEEAIDRLIGSPSKGLYGVLTTAVTNEPYGILLLDELEKAYPKALDIFLQILDEGFVTDGYGQKINFRNCIIIATTNAGAVLARELFEQKKEQKERERIIIDTLVATNVYRMEFLNRFDSLVFFLPLVDEELQQVAILKLNELTERLQKEKNITLTFDDGVSEELVRRGYEPVFGARSLNRYISDTIEDHIARALIEGKVISGGTLQITLADIQV